MLNYVKGEMDSVAPKICLSSNYISPRVVLRIPDIHGDLNQTVISISDSDPCSPNDITFKDISKTLTPRSTPISGLAGGSRGFKANIRPSTAVRRVDLSKEDKEQATNNNDLESHIPNKTFIKKPKGFNGGSQYLDLERHVQNSGMCGYIKQVEAVQQVNNERKSECESEKQICDDGRHRRIESQLDADQRGNNYFKQAKGVEHHLNPDGDINTNPEENAALSKQVCSQNMFKPDGRGDQYKVDTDECGDNLKGDQTGNCDFKPDETGDYLKQCKAVENHIQLDNTELHRLKPEYSDTESMEQDEMSSYNDSMTTDDNYEDDVTLQDISADSRDSISKDLEIGNHDNNSNNNDEIAQINSNNHQYVVVTNSSRPPSQVSIKPVNESPLTFYSIPTYGNLLSINPNSRPGSAIPRSIEAGFYGSSRNSSPFPTLNVKDNNTSVLNTPKSATNILLSVPHTSNICLPILSPAQPIGELHQTSSPANIIIGTSQQAVTSPNNLIYVQSQVAQSSNIVYVPYPVPVNTVNVVQSDTVADDIFSKKEDLKNSNETQHNTVIRDTIGRPTEQVNYNYVGKNREINDNNNDAGHSLGLMLKQSANDKNSSNNLEESHFFKPIASSSFATSEFGVKRSRKTSRYLYQQRRPLKIESSSEDDFNNNRVEPGKKFSPGGSGRSFKEYKRIIKLKKKIERQIQDKENVRKIANAHLDCMGPDAKVPKYHTNVMKNLTLFQGRGFGEPLAAKLPLKSDKPTETNNINDTTQDIDSYKDVDLDNRRLVKNMYAVSCSESRADSTILAGNITCDNVNKYHKDAFSSASHSRNDCNIVNIASSTIVGDQDSTFTMESNIAARDIENDVSNITVMSNIGNNIASNQVKNAGNSLTSLNVINTAQSPSLLQKVEELLRYTVPQIPAVFPVNNALIASSPQNQTKILQSGGVTNFCNSGNNIQLGGVTNCVTPPSLQVVLSSNGQYMLQPNIGSPVGVNTNITPPNHTNIMASPPFVNFTQNSAAVAMSPLVTANSLATVINNTTQANNMQSAILFPIQYQGQNVNNIHGLHSSLNLSNLPNNGNNLTQGIHQNQSHITNGPSFLSGSSFMQTANISSMFPPSNVIQLNDTEMLHQSGYDTNSVTLNTNNASALQHSIDPNVIQPPINNPRSLLKAKVNSINQSIANPLIQPQVNQAELKSPALSMQQQDLTLSSRFSPISPSNLTAVKDHLVNNYMQKLQDGGNNNNKLSGNAGSARTSRHDFKAPVVDSKLSNSRQICTELVTDPDTLILEAIQCSPSASAVMKRPKSKSFSIKSLKIGNFQYALDGENKSKFAQLQFMAAAKKLVYELELIKSPDDPDREKCPFSMIEIPFSTIVNIRHFSEYAVVLEVNAAPEVVLGYKLYDHTGCSLRKKGGSYNRNNHFDLTNGELLHTPYHEVTMMNPEARLVILALAKYEPRFCGILGKPMLLNPNRRLPKAPSPITGTTISPCRNNSSSVDQVKVGVTPPQVEGASTPQPQRSCTCNQRCQYARCGCVIRNTMCGDGCKCHKTHKNCNNPINIMVNNGLNYQEILKDPCLMANMKKVLSPELLLSQQICFPCCNHVTTVAMCVPGVVVCPGCHNYKYEFSWCLDQLCPQWNDKARRHCVTCGKCCKLTELHCEPCRTCHQSGSQDCKMLKWKNKRNAMQKHQEYLIRNMITRSKRQKNSSLMKPRYDQVVPGNTSYIGGVSHKLDTTTSHFQHPQNQDRPNQTNSGQQTNLRSQISHTSHMSNPLSEIMDNPTAIYQKSSVNKPHDVFLGSDLNIQNIRTSHDNEDNSITQEEHHHLHKNTDGEEESSKYEASTPATNRTFLEADYNVVNTKQPLPFDNVLLGSCGLNSPAPGYVSACSTTDFDAINRPQTMENIDALNCRSPLNNHNGELNNHTSDLNNYTGNLNNHAIDINNHTVYVNNHNVNLNNHTVDPNNHIGNLNNHTSVLNQQRSGFNHQAFNPNNDIDRIISFKEGLNNYIHITDNNDNINNVCRQTPGLINRSNSIEAQDLSKKKPQHDPNTESHSIGNSVGKIGNGKELHNKLPVGDGYDPYTSKHMQSHQWQQHQQPPFHSFRNPYSYPQFLHPANPTQYVQHYMPCPYRQIGVNSTNKEIHTHRLSPNEQMGVTSVNQDNPMQHYPSPYWQTGAHQGSLSENKEEIAQHYSGQSSRNHNGNSTLQHSFLQYPQLAQPYLAAQYNYNRDVLSQYQRQMPQPAHQDLSQQHQDFSHQQTYHCMPFSPMPNTGLSDPSRDPIMHFGSASETQSVVPTAGKTCGEDDQEFEIADSQETDSETEIANQLPAGIGNVSELPSLDFGEPLHTSSPLTKTAEK